MPLFMPVSATKLSISHHVMHTKLGGAKLKSGVVTAALARSTPSSRLEPPL